MGRVIPIVHYIVTRLCQSSVATGAKITGGIYGHKTPAGTTAGKQSGAVIQVAE
ncbi:MAG: hypothetical protein LUH15_18785 [Tannerellaceae bacterium]|nr:hypothetical protein [Tannerellaceae bacterium]